MYIIHIYIYIYIYIYPLIFYICSDRICIHIYNILHILCLYIIYITYILCILYILCIYITYIYTYRIFIIKKTTYLKLPHMRLFKFLYL